MSNWKVTPGSGGGSFEKAPAGNHPAVLVAIVDMGKQWGDGYQGAPGKWQHRAFFVWELVGEKKADGTNHLIGIDLTISLHEKAKLRKWLEARSNTKIPDSGEYDIGGELGKPCLLNVIEKNGYPKIDGISSLPKGMTCPPASQKPYSWNGVGELKAGEKPTLPSWLPWFYGKPIADTIAICEELGGKAGDSPAAGGGQAAPTAAPASGAPPRRQQSQGNYFDQKYWVEVNPDGEPVAMTHAELQAWLQANGKQPELIFVCKDGTNDYKPAKDFGFQGIPY